MKTIKGLLACLLLPLLLCCCTARNADWFAPFTKNFEAEVDGTIAGEAFSALIKSEVCTQGDTAADNLPLVNITFYAPKALEGTVLTRDTNGEITMTVGGDMVIKNPTIVGFSDLFGLFPVAGDIKDIQPSDGNTTVTGENFSVTFQKDGTPIACSAGSVQVTVVHFTS